MKNEPTISNSSSNNGISITKHKIKLLSSALVLSSSRTCSTITDSTTKEKHFSETYGSLVWKLAEKVYIVNQQGKKNLYNWFKNHIKEWLNLRNKSLGAQVKN